MKGIDLWTETNSIAMSNIIPVRPTFIW